MEDNVIRFPGVTVKEEIEELLGEKVSTDDVLENAKGLGLDDIILIGRDVQGRFYFASTSGNPQSILFDIESAKHILMSASLMSFDQGE